MSFDTFISYNRRDTGPTETLASALRDRGVSVFLDRWNLEPGTLWIPALERALTQAPALVVVVGPGDLTPWQHRETELAFRRIQDGADVLVVPVLIPGGDPPLGLLGLHSWVDLRAGLDQPPLLDLLADLIRNRKDAGPRLSICPYRGLHPFRQEDAPFFFGRDEFVKRAMQSVSSRGITAIVGASGSGKSSAVRAGLLPQLQKDERNEWVFIVTRPGRDPFHSLVVNVEALKDPGPIDTDPLLRNRQRANALDSGELPLSDIVEEIASHRTSRPRVLLFVDQWEELYTQCGDDGMRTRFIDAVLDASTAGTLATVFTVRGDFFDDVLDHRTLADRLRDGVETIGPMNRDELRQCIEAPASKVGLLFEKGLVDRILDEVEGGAGSLPLLQYVLMELWKKRRGDTLVHDAYQAMGGLSGAIAMRAEEEFRKLTPDLQDRLHGVMLQLVRAGTTDTRRTARRSEIGEQAWPVVVAMADARLLVTAGEEATSGDETVELAHEALIRHWKRLRDWLDEDREFLLWRHRLDAAVEQFDVVNRSPAALLQGSLLDEARRWKELRHARLSERETAFIEASRWRDRVLRWRRTANRAILATIALLLVLSSTRMLRNRRQLRQQQQAAILSSASEVTDPVVAALLIGTLSPRTEPMGGAVVARRIASRPVPIAVLDRGEGRLTSAVISPDGSSVLTGYADGSVLKWNGDGTGDPRALRSLDGSIHRLAFSQDGRLALAVSSAGQLRVWRHEGDAEVAGWVNGARNVADAAFGDGGASVIIAHTDSTVRIVPVDASDNGRVIRVRNGQPQRLFANTTGRRFAVTVDRVVELWTTTGSAEPIVLRGHVGSVNRVTFDSSGSVVATASNDGTARVWPTSQTGGRVVHRSANGAAVWSVELDPAGRQLLTADDTGDVVLRALDSINTVLASRSHGDRAWAARLSPDGQRVASAAADSAMLWRATAGGEELALRGHDGPVIAVEFSADGSRLITVSQDNTVRVWPSQGRTDPLVFYAPSTVHAAALSADTHSIAIATEDGTAWIWKPDENSHLQLSGHARGVSSIAFDTSSTRVVTGSWDGLGRVWDATNGHLLATLTGHSRGVTARFAIDRSLIATASEDGTGRIWSGESFEHVVQLLGHADLVKDAAFSRDGSLVATASFDSTARVWNTSDGTPRATFHHRGPVSSIAFHPDGTRLLTASADSTAALWTLATDSPQYLRGHEGAVTTALFDPAGERVLTASKDQTARVWRLDRASEPIILRGHGGQVLSARFSSDGRQVVTASTDGAARVFFSIEQRSEPIVLEARAVVRDAFFTRDAARVVTISEDRGVRVWRIGWSTLHQHLSSATTACLRPALRIQYRHETASQAMNNYLDCERKHGRSTTALETTSE